MEYVLPVHAMHCDAPAVEENVPGAQASHGGPPVLLKLPGAHVKGVAQFGPVNPALQMHWPDELQNPLPLHVTEAEQNVQAG